MSHGNGTSKIPPDLHTVAADEATRAPVSDPIASGPAVRHSVTATIRTTVLPKRRRAESNAMLDMQAHPRFERLKKLGEGGIGEVALAVDHDISRRVAMKRLRTDRKDAQSLVRFAEEVRIVGQLEHPGIVPVHDVGVDEDGQHYLVMKYVDGETLEDVIAKLRKSDPAYLERFPYSHRMQVFASIVEAIGYAHDKGIIHRDIKPANIMIGPHGEVTVMDWGIAKYANEKDTPDSSEQRSVASTVQDRLIQTQHGALVGTPLYMSPEQAAGRNDSLDARSDIFSLGLVFCEFLVLHHPLEDKPGMNEILAELIAKGVDMGAIASRARAAGVPMEIQQVMAGALEHDRSKRYQSAKEMLQRIRRVQDGQVTVACHVTAFKRVAYEAIHWVDRNPHIYSLILLGLVLSAIAGLGVGAYRLVHAF
jgi:eukaryotic-like serine/threonine-protein kinase